MYLCIYDAINNTVSSLNNVLMNGNMINEWKTGKDVEESDHYLFQSTILAFI